MLMGLSGPSWRNGRQESLKHGSPIVRAAAVKTLAYLAGSSDERNPVG